MTSILALSVTGKIEQYGAYAGFAAVLGLAVLSLLYFAQAREVKRLREWAGRAPERAADLQDRVQSSAQQRVVAQPQARPVGAQPAVPGAAARPAAATPAGQAQAAPGVVPAAAAAATAAGAAGTATATPGTPALPAGAPGGPGSGQPTTVQPAANGASAVPQPKPGQPLRVPPSAATPPPPRAGSAPIPEPEGHGRSIWAILGAAAALVAVAAVVVFVVIGVIGGSGGNNAANTIGTPGQKAASPGAGGSKASTGASTTPTATPKPGTYTVAVLNGTAVPGLARGVANRLQNTKFKIGNVTNAADQSRSATLVEYAPGHLAEAQAVAKSIDVGKDAIQAVDPGSRAIAGEQASVVVIVGSDQNTSPQSQP
jgi:hypothetical protein